MKKRNLVFLFLAAMISASLLSCSPGRGGQATASSAGESILVRLAHGAPEEHSSHIGYIRFKEVLEAESNGVMNVELYPNMQMGGDREMLEAAQFGNTTGGSSSASPIAAFAKEFFVLDAPFMFSSRDEVYRILDGEPGQKLLTYLERINLKGLGYMENGFRNLTCNKLIRTPEDLRGVKIRVMENEVQILTWSSLNANPTPMSFGELFTALQQRVVDAQENPIEFIYTQKFFEVQNYLMLTQHIYTPLVMYVNLNFYNNLSPQHKDLFERAAREAIVHNRRVATENEIKAKEAIQNDIQIVELSDRELRAFSDLMGPVYTTIRRRVDNDELANLFLN